MALKNPFFFRELSMEAPFCNRQKELRELQGYAEGKANVVLFSPRRFGKTSLVKRVQGNLAQRGYTTIFADFFGATSVEEIATRLAKAVFEVTKPKRSLFQKAIQILKSFRPVLKPNEEGGLSLSVEFIAPLKSGLEVLDDTIHSLGIFAKEIKNRLQVALDEFQEITELRESAQIEGILRQHVQKQSFSYFFIGSRRQVLLSIFNDRKRPFFQSAINYELKQLPHEELVPFIVHLFEQGEKFCRLDVANLISKKISQHPYYAQKLSFFVFEVSQNDIQEEDVTKGFQDLLSSERQVFEAILQGLAPKQIALLQALAREPSASIFSVNYIKRHHLGSSGGIQGAVKRLLALDLIERGPNRILNVVDPVFQKWLVRS